MPRVSHVQEETIISDRVHCVQCITQSRPVTDGRIRSLARLLARARDAMAVVVVAIVLPVAMVVGGPHATLLPRIICPAFEPVNYT